MDDLKPCPFCGSHILEVDRFPHHDSTLWFITCYECPCQGVEHKEKEEAIKAWNTRIGEDK